MRAFSDAATTGIVGSLVEATRARGNSGRLRSPHRCSASHWPLLRKRLLWTALPAEDVETIVDLVMLSLLHLATRPGTGPARPSPTVTQVPSD